MGIMLGIQDYQLGNGIIYSYLGIDILIINYKNILQVC